MNWNLVQWLGYMGTWPSILEYQKKFGVGLVVEIEDELESEWGEPFSPKLINLANLFIGWARDLLILVLAAKRSKKFYNLPKN